MCMGQNYSIFGNEFFSFQKVSIKILAVILVLLFLKAGRTFCHYFFIFCARKIVSLVTGPNMLVTPYILLV